jgi:hypothetical protein
LTNTFESVKVHKRLWLREVETGNLVYTPPEWVRSRLQGREPMRELAAAMTERGRYDINLIIEFETRYNPRTRKRT